MLMALLQYENFSRSLIDHTEKYTEGSSDKFQFMIFQFGAIWAVVWVIGILNFFHFDIKSPTSKDVFFYVYTKKLMNIKVRKMSILILRLHFFG